MFLGHSVNVLGPKVKASTWGIVARRGKEEFQLEKQGLTFTDCVCGAKYGIDFSQNLQGLLLFFLKCLN